MFTGMSSAGFLPSAPSCSFAIRRLGCAKLPDENLAFEPELVTRNGKPVSVILPLKLSRTSGAS